MALELPKTKYGRCAAALICIMPLFFFIGFTLASSYYGNVSSGNTIISDIARRPLLAIAMLTGMFCGIAAFISGFIAISMKKDRSLVVYGATLIGGIFSLFLLGEVLFPH